MLRYALMVMITAGVFAFDVFTIGPIVRLQSAATAIVPDFRDKKIWGQAKDHIFINLEDGIPWSMSYFYVRIDDSLVMGMDLVLIWDLDTAVYKVWGPADAPRQSLFRRGSGWTAPMSGAKMESIPRIDWWGHRAIGVTVMVYDGDAERPSVWEVFLDPAIEVELDALSPSPMKREL